MLSQDGAARLLLRFDRSNGSFREPVIPLFGEQLRCGAVPFQLEPIVIGT